MKISTIGSNFQKAGIQAQQAASKAFDEALSGKGMEYISDAFQKEGSVTKFPSVFAGVVKGGAVGFKDFIFSFVKNMIK